MPGLAGCWRIKRKVRIRTEFMRKEPCCWLGQLGPRFVQKEIKDGRDGGVRVERKFVRDINAFRLVQSFEKK